MQTSTLFNFKNLQIIIYKLHRSKWKPMAAYVSQIFWNTLSTVCKMVNRGVKIGLKSLMCTEYTTALLGILGVFKP